MAYGMGNDEEYVYIYIPNISTVDVSSWVIPKKTCLFYWDN
jgi:hypothetical protein